LFISAKSVFSEVENLEKFSVIAKELYFPFSGYSTGYELFFYLHAWYCRQPGHTVLTRKFLQKSLSSSSNHSKDGEAATQASLPPPKEKKM
jgi:hypothetical protein